MFRVSQRWFLTLMALLTFAVGGCGGGGNGGTDDLGNPVDPFVPNLPGSGSGAVSAPRNVSGEALDRSIRVTWDPVAGADGYYVYTSTDGSTFVRQNLALYTTTSILLTGLENERTYFVGVSAVRGNRESDTAYAGGGPGRMPLVPRAEPLPEPPETVIEEITVWQDAEVPDSVTNPPDDRRILVTWHTLSAADVDRFLVEFFVANRLGNGSLSQPDPGNLIPIGNPQVVRPGDLAMLQDLDFFRDPAAPQIATIDPAPVGQFRTEAVLPMPYGNAVLLRVASALNTTDPDAVLETLAELGYTAGNLGITTVNGQLRLDQNDLDGTGTLGVAVRVTPILDNGENGEPAWDFGYYFDRRPMKVTNINVAFAPNPDLDEDPEAPPLPLLTWFRLPYPMGSDIVDYGVIRDGPGGRFTYRLGAEDPTAVINEEGVHNNLLTFVDNNDPPIRGNATYFYSIFGIDRALQFGMPSEGILVQPGGPPADPPIVELEVTQGNRDIIPGGQSIIAGGNPPTPVQVDFSGSTADEGRFIVEYRLQIGDGPVQTFDEPDPPAFIINCVPSQQVITVTAQVVDDQGNESEEKEFEVVLDPDPSCTAG